MKKRFIKKICSKALAAVTGAAVFASAYAPTLASAADETKYISEVYLSYGNTPKEAKDWLEKNGYTVLDQDLNEDAAGGISWLGVNFSDKRSVYLGYKTTTDSEDAIRDMRAMNMNGEYSYDEYEKLLENKKSEINSFIADMKTALAEYRSNYEKGTAKAKYAHDKMNKLYDDDSGLTGLGDLLLKPIKEEMTEEEYNAAAKEHADMTTLVMQGNLSQVNTLMSDLCMAADTSETGWLSRIKAEGGYDELVSRCEKEFPQLSESKLSAVLASKYDEQAKILADKFTELKEFLKTYTECPVNSDSSETEIEAYFKEHTDKSQADWLLAGSEYLLLNETKYEGSTLAELVTGTKYDFEDPDDRAVLYPLIDAMSEGQRALLSYVDAGELLIYGSLDENGWKQSAEDAKTTLESTVSTSVYQGVDRSIFKPAGVALTSEARKLQSATGANYSNRLFGEYSTYYEIAGFTTGIILVGAGMVALSHAGSLKNTAANLRLSVENDLAAYDRALDRISDAFAIYAEYKDIKYIENVELLQGSREIRFNSFLKFEPRASGNIKEYTIKRLVNNELIEETIDREQFFNAFVEDIKAHRNTYLSDMDEYYKVLDSSQFAGTGNEARLNENRALINKFNKSGTAWKTAGVILCVAGTLLALGSAVTTVYDLYNYYHQSYAPIPGRIVHESTDDKGRYVYTVYDCALCNRDAQGFGKADLGAYGDMNGDVGKQWLALYTTKDKAAGDPITADIIAQKGSNKVPTDKGAGIRLFGKNDTVNLVSTEYCYNDKLGGLYIFSGTVKTDEKPAETPADKTDSSEATADTSSEAETSSAADSSSTAAAATDDTSSDSDEKATGSVVGTGVMVASCAGSAAIGALICFLIARRRKESAA